MDKFYAGNNLFDPDICVITYGTHVRGFWDVYSECHFPNGSITTKGN